MIHEGCPVNLFRRKLPIRMAISNAKPNSKDGRVVPKACGLRTTRVRVGRERSRETVTNTFH